MMHHFDIWLPTGETFVWFIIGFVLGWLAVAIIAVTVVIAKWKG